MKDKIELPSRSTQVISVAIFITQPLTALKIFEIK